MYMAVSLMVIDTQEALAVRKRAFPVISRSLQCFCHRYSYQVDHQIEKLQRLDVFACGLKMSNLYVVYHL